MIRRLIGIAALLVLASAPPTGASTASAPILAGSRAPGSAPVHVDISIFYNELSPYGHWFTYGSYGWVWTPYDVPYGWRPYTHGHWIYTDCGWTWVSDWRWGWGPFHYGRWLFDPDYGWIWVPGTVWGPAWVAWRWSDDWVGWAPLPPAVGWQVGVGLRFGDPRARWEPDAGCWSFTRPRWLLDPGVRYKLEPLGRNVTMMRTTRLVTDYDELGGRPRDRGRDIREFEKLVGRPAPRYRVVDAVSATQAERVGVRNEARVYRPDVRPAPEKRPVVREPVAPSPTPRELQARRDQERRKVDAYYKQEQTRLESQQRVEARQAAPANRSEMNRIHQQEVRSLQDQRVREERAREQRIEKRIEKPAPAKPAAPSKGREGRGRGKS